MVSGFFLQHHEVSEDGLAYRSMTGARKDLRWSDLKAVRYSPAKKSFRLETRAGDSARISAMLMGLPDWLRQRQAARLQLRAADISLPVAVHRNRETHPRRQSLTCAALGPISSAV
jgi:hypothetical protein